MKLNSTREFLEILPQDGYFLEEQGLAIQM